MRRLLLGLIVAIGLAPNLAAQTQTPAAPKVQLTFEEGGKVTLLANGATLREILAEWTRKGGTPFVFHQGASPDRLATGTLTLEYAHKAETDVVASLLRSASGVIMAPRREGTMGASQLEVVFVLATSNATAATSYSSPTYSAPQPQISSPGDPTEEIAPIGPGRGASPLPTQGPMGPNPSQAPTRPAGVSGVAVPVVGIPSTVTPPTGPTTPPPPATTGTGRGGGGGGGR